MFSHYSSLAFPSATTLYLFRRHIGLQGNKTQDMKETKQLHRECKEKNKQNSHIHHSQYQFFGDVFSGILSSTARATPHSPLTFDASLDNVLEYASIVEQSLGHDAHSVHRPRSEPVNNVETLRSVHGL